MAGAMDWVLTMQQELAAEKKGNDEKKRAHQHYADAVLLLSKLYAMAAASEAARGIRDEVGFFQGVRAALVKTTAAGGRSAADRELAIQQIVSRAVVSTEIVDIMAAAGLDRPDISVLSDEFLAEVRDLDKKNLAIEALRKLLNGQVHSQGKRNVVQARAFSERLESAIARYHTNAVTTVEVLEELIKLAQEIRSARARGEESGLSEDEIAFYDALADNQSARHVMGEPACVPPGQRATRGKAWVDDVVCGRLRGAQGCPLRARGVAAISGESRRHFSDRRGILAGISKEASSPLGTSERSCARSQE